MHCWPRPLLHRFWDLHATDEAAAMDHESRPTVWVVANVIKVDAGLVVDLIDPYLLRHFSRAELCVQSLTRLNTMSTGQATHCKTWWC